MKFAGERLRLSASDVANFMACQHMTRLDLLAARGQLRRVREFDVRFEDLVKRGEARELTVLEQFKAVGRSIAEISQRPDADAEAAQATWEAVRCGRRCPASAGRTSRRGTGCRLIAAQRLARSACEEAG